MSAYPTQKQFDEALESRGLSKHDVLAHANWDIDGPRSTLDESVAIRNVSCASRPALKIISFDLGNQHFVVGVKP